MPHRILESLIRRPGCRQLSRLLVVIAFMAFPAFACQAPVKAMSEVADSEAKAAQDNVSRVKTTFTKTFTKQKPDAETYYQSQAAKSQIAAAESDLQQAAEYKRQAASISGSNPEYAEKLRNMEIDKYQQARGWLQKASSVMGKSDRATATTATINPPQSPSPGCGQACQQLVQIAKQSGPATKLALSDLKLPDFENSPKPQVPSGVELQQQQTKFFQAAPQVMKQDGKEVLQLPRGNVVDLSAVKSAVATVSPELANQSMFPPCGSGGGTCTNPNLIKVLTDPAQRDAIDKVGGVALAATFDLLAVSGYSEFRSHGNVSVTDRPILVSLKALAKAVVPYVDGDNWRNLPEDLRFPGNISRVKGYVFDEVNDDLILVGSEAEHAASRLDIDVVTTSIREVWREGKVMGVSLDPRPDRIGGSQYPRLISVPNNSIVAKIMLDADYAMKQISANSGWAKDVPFLNWDEVYGSTKCGAGHGARFWLTPQFLGRDSIYSSTTGRTMLVETTVEVQTEQEVIGKEELLGTGSRSREDVVLAHAFTDNLPAFESDPRIQPKDIFRKLHGVVDMGTLAAIWRNKYPHSNTLRQFSELPIRVLAGEESYPATYTGVYGEINVKDCRWSIVGGVHVDLREGALAGTQYQDRIAAVLEGAALGISVSNKVTSRVDTSFALAKAALRETSDRENALMLSVTNALNNNDYKTAEDGYRALIKLNPGEPQGYAGLAQLELNQDNPKKAAPWAVIAMHLAPNDERLQLLGLDIGWRLNPDELESTYSPVEREELSRLYAGIAENYRAQGFHDAAKRFANWATELWEGNGYAYWTLALLTDSEISRTALLVRAAEGFRAEVKKGFNDAKGSLAVAMTMLAARRLILAENLLDFRTARVLKKTELSDSMIVGFFDEADANVDEALAYDPRLVDAAALRIVIKAERFLYNQQNHKHSVGEDMTTFVTLAKELCKKFPQSVAALEALSGVLQLNHADQEAAKYLNAAIAIEPLNVALFVNRAQIEVANSDCAEARADIAKAVSLAGDGAADSEFKQQLEFGPDNKCAAAGIL